MRATHITPEEIKFLRTRILNQNYIQFARTIGIASGQGVKSWELGRGRPTGPRYDKLLALKNKYIETFERAASAKPPISQPEVPAPTPTKLDFIFNFLDTYRSLNSEQRRLLKGIITLVEAEAP